MQNINEKALAVTAEVSKAVLGKPEVVLKIMMAILARGHVLIEDIPGVGKTTLAQAFARAMDLTQNRVQFTPDVLPSDIVGFSLYQKETGKFVYHPGAVMCNLFLADEINRTSARTQSALLEVMEESAVTVDGVTRVLPQPFTVFATENPVGSVGTQMLPESQLDRFMVCVVMGYPDAEAEMEILARQPRHAVKEALAVLGGFRGVRPRRGVERPEHVAQPGNVPREHGDEGRIDAQPPRIRLALGIAHLPHSPARALQFRGRVGQTRIVGEHGLEGGFERVRRSARLFRDEPPFREPLHGNAERVRLRGDLGLPLGDPDERGGRVGEGPPESGAERRDLLQGGLERDPVDLKPQSGEYLLSGYSHHARSFSFAAIKRRSFSSCTVRASFMSATSSSESVPSLRPSYRHSPRRTGLISQSCPSGSVTHRIPQPSPHGSKPRGGLRKNRTGCLSGHAPRCRAAWSDPAGT